MCEDAKANMHASNICNREEHYIPNIPGYVMFYCPKLTEEQCFRVSENCTWSNFPATWDVVSARSRFISVAKDTIAGAIADTVGQCFETGYCEALRRSMEVMKISRRTSQTTDNVFEKCHNTKATLKVSALNDITKAVAEAWNAIYSSIEWERRIVGKQLAKRAILHHLYENRVSVTQIYWSQWTPCCSKILSLIQLWLLHVLKMISP